MRYGGIVLLIIVMLWPGLYSMDSALSNDNNSHILEKYDEIGECSICMEQMQLVVQICSSKHFMHASCFQGYKEAQSQIGRNLTCPACRGLVISGDHQSASLASSRCVVDKSVNQIESIVSKKYSMFDRIKGTTDKDKTILCNEIGLLKNCIADLVRQIELRNDEYAVLQANCSAYENRQRSTHQEYELLQNRYVELQEKYQAIGGGQNAVVEGRRNASHHLIRPIHAESVKRQSKDIDTQHRYSSISHQHYAYCGVGILLSTLFIDGIMGWSKLCRPPSLLSLMATTLVTAATGYGVSHAFMQLKGVRSYALRATNDLSNKVRLPCMGNVLGMVAVNAVSYLLLSQSIIHNTAYTSSQIIGKAALMTGVPFVVGRMMYCI